jgi:hypothetical protein
VKMPRFCNSSHVNVTYDLLFHSGVASLQGTYWPNFCYYSFRANVVVVLTLVLLLFPRLIWYFPALLALCKLELRATNFNHLKLSSHFFV